MRMFLRSRGLFFSVGCLTFAASCATAPKDYRYMAEPEYQGRPTLSRALLQPAEPVSEAAVQKILASKVVLPRKVNLAIVRLADSADGLDFQTVDQEIADRFYAAQSWGSRVQSVIPVPSLLLPKPVSLAALRQAAVFLQADALLVVKPASYGNWKMELFRDNQAKGITTLEVLLLDTRTSVIPYTSLVTESVEISGEKADYTNAELLSRAKKTSEAKALLKVPAALAKFLASAP